MSCRQCPATGITGDGTPNVDAGAEQPDGLVRAQPHGAAAVQRHLQPNMVSFLLTKSGIILSDSKVESNLLLAKCGSWLHHVEASSGALLRVRHIIPVRSNVPSTCTACRICCAGAAAAGAAARICATRCALDGSSSTVSVQKAAGTLFACNLIAVQSGTRVCPQDTPQLERWQRNAGAAKGVVPAPNKDEACYHCSQTHP